MKMNGLISDLNIVLSSLNQISVEAFSSRNHHVECFEGVATYDLSHDVVCVAMETNFQYISFERGRKVAVFDIVVIDSSLILPGSDTSSNYVLRLYGSSALTASIGSSRVTRGSILFLNQCYSNITFKNKNELTIKNREQEMGCVKTEKAALLQSRYNATSLPRPPSLSVPPSVLSPLPLPLPLPPPPPQLNVNLLNMKKEVSLKLRPSTGSIHLLIANGTDCVGTGMCRGAYPNLYRQADILSVWCEQNSSLFLSRLVPIRSVYVPGLREAFGFNLIDIVLDHSTEPLRRGNNIRRNNITCGAVDKSKNKMGMNKGSEKEIGEKEMEKESGGRAVHQTDITCPETILKPTETKNSKPALSDDCFSKELSLRMTDSAGTSVKLQFYSKDQLNNVLELLHSAGTASQRITAPILFKSVTVKSLFSNSVTCLQATEISKFAILECCDVTANNPSVVECTWSELRSLAYGHPLRPIHDGEVEGEGKENQKEKEKEKGEESGQVVEGREGERQLEGRVLELNGHRLLQAHRGKLLSVKGTLLHVNFAANRSSITRDSSSKRNWNRGGGDRHRHDIDYVEKSVIGVTDQSESDMRSKYTSKIITKVPVTEIGTVEYNTELCFCDRSTYGAYKCKNEYVHRCGNCVERAQAVGEIDGEVKNKDIGVGLCEEVLREGEGADDGVERENDDTFMQALLSVTRLSDDEFKGTSDNWWTARTKSKTNGQHTLKKQKRDNAGECAVSIRFKEARFIIGPASISVKSINTKAGMDVPRNFYRPESESSSTDQTKTRNQCQKEDKKKYEYEYECINDNEYCCQNNQSLHSTVPSTPLEMDFVIVSVYDEGIQKLFGNISARDVAVCCTRNRELEKQKIISKQSKNRSSDCGMENRNKSEEEEEQEQEVKNNRNMNMNGSTMDPPCPYLTSATTSASASHSRCLSHVGKAEHDLQTCFCQNSEVKNLLDRLPSFNYSESCARTVDSLMRSSHKKEQYTFLLRLNQFVDENGIRVSGGRSALSLEGILPST